MQYKGKLYGKVGGKYIDLEKTANDFDSMESKIKELEFEAMERRADLQDLENDNNKYTEDIDSLQKELIYARGVADDRDKEIEGLRAQKNSDQAHIEMQREVNEDFRTKLLLERQRSEGLVKALEPFYKLALAAKDVFSSDQPIFGFNGAEIRVSDLEAVLNTYATSKPVPVDPNEYDITKEE